MLKSLLRLSALLLALSFTACPLVRDESVTSFVPAPAEDPTPSPTPYEDPGDCACRIVAGKRVCNSACPAGGL